ncbi:MAG: nucleoside/nucleotide kinase family protein [Chloroflexi bacterium]|nr:nucleoside/nucleotide kinase family protein [Chloroflexota bacterium]
MDQWSERAGALVPPNRRAVLGIVGTPGSGKSTVADRIVADLGSPFALVVPMDGFHLSNHVLEDLGLRHRKGAIETFDGHGYVDLLRRLREPSDAPVLAPEFDRGLDESIAARIMVTPATRLVITEGNYLLDNREPWSGVRPLLDAIWYVDLDDDVRRARLRARHESFGMSPAAAERWVMEVDEPNAVRIAAARSRANLVIEVD